MKSFIIWISGLVVGAILGYLSTYLLEILPIITVCCGIILGSSISITINILRDDELEPHEVSTSDE